MSILGTAAQEGAGERATESVEWARSGMTRTSARSVGAVLDDAIRSLAMLDCERLEELEREVRAGLEAGRTLLVLPRDRRGREEALSQVAARHRMLGSLLDTTKTNLGVLQGLQRRNLLGGEPWGR